MIARFRQWLDDEEPLTDMERLFFGLLGAVLFVGCFALMFWIGR